MNNVCLLHFENAKWATLDDAKKTTVLTWLADYCPEDIIEAIRGGERLLY